MIDAGLWDAFWERLQRRYAALAEAMRECNDDLHWNADRYESEAFPFRAHAYFSRSRARREEDVTLSVNCWKGPRAFELSADVARDGTVVLDSYGPASFPYEREPADNAAPARSAFDQIDDFFASQADLMRRELCP